MDDDLDAVPIGAAQTFNGYTTQMKKKAQMKSKERIHFAEEV